MQHYSRVCLGSQCNTIQESSPHYSQKVSCKAFNAVIAAFPLDILGHFPVLCSHSAYPYQQSVFGPFSQTTDYLYGPRPWLAEEVHLLGKTPWTIMIKTDFSVC